MRHPVPCPQWAEKLFLRREDLSPSDCVALDAHLACCLRCTEAFAEHNKLVAQLRDLPPAKIARLLLEEDAQAPKARVRFMTQQAAPHPQPVLSTRGASWHLEAALLLAASIILGSLLLLGSFSPG